MTKDQIEKLRPLVQAALDMRLEYDRTLRAIEEAFGEDIEGLDNRVDESAPGEADDETVVWVVTGSPLEKCGECGTYVPEVIGCPDGAEICRECFETGKH